MITLVSGIAILAQLSVAAPRNGEDVLRDMHDFGVTKWFKSVTFVQTTKLANRPDQIWYESWQLPGLLRIDRAPVDSMNSTLYRFDSTYSYIRGALRAPRAGGNPLAILFGDVFAEPVTTTITRLAPFKIDLTKLRADKWDNRPVWVVGAAAGDTLTPQFWVDQERHYVVRLVYGPVTAAADVQVLGHQPAAGGWIETEIKMMRNGVEIQREIYQQINVNPTLDSWVFDAGPWKKPSWIPGN